MPPELPQTYDSIRRPRAMSISTTRRTFTRRSRLIVSVTGLVDPRSWAMEPTWCSTILSAMSQTKHL